MSQELHKVKLELAVPEEQLPQVYEYLRVIVAELGSDFGVEATLSPRKLSLPPQPEIQLDPTFEPISTRTIRRYLDQLSRPDNEPAHVTKAHVLNYIYEHGLVESSIPAFAAAPGFLNRETVLQVLNNRTETSEVRTLANLQHILKKIVQDRLEGTIQEQGIEVPDEIRAVSIAELEAALVATGVDPIKAKTTWVRLVRSTSDEWVNKDQVYTPEAREWYGNSRMRAATLHPDFMSLFVLSENFAEFSRVFRITRFGELAFSQVQTALKYILNSRSRFK